MQNQDPEESVSLMRQSEESPTPFETTTLCQRPKSATESIKMQVCFPVLARCVIWFGSLKLLKILAASDFGIWGQLSQLRIGIEGGG